MAAGNEDSAVVEQRHRIVLPHWRVHPVHRRKGVCAGVVDPGDREPFTLDLNGSHEKDPAVRQRRYIMRSILSFGYLRWNSGDTCHRYQFELSLARVVQLQIEDWQLV